MKLTLDNLNGIRIKTKGRGRGNDVDKAVSDKLRYLRLLKGFSQNEIAQAIGVSIQQIQKYEKGTNRIAIGRLVEISNILKVDITSFIEGKAPDYMTADLSMKDQQYLARLNSNFVKLDSKQKELIHELVLELVR